MAHQSKTLRSDIAWRTPDRITVRGLDLPGEILGRLNLADFSFLQITGRVPTPQESEVYNALLITLVEHGVTPSVIAARMTYAGAPESFQAAVAAGLCGLGSVYVGSMEGAARMLTEALDGDDGTTDLTPLAEQIVADHRARKVLVPGIGHGFHKPVDPRAPRLFEIAEANGLSGRYVHLMNEVAEAAERASGRNLPCNATGAVGALTCELGLPWRMVRGLGVMSRAIGLVGHLLEESQDPMADEIWRRTEHEASEHLVSATGATAGG